MPGPEALHKEPRIPFAYPRRESPRFNDPDETEGRRLYRGRANAEAAKVKRRATLRKDEDERA